MYTQIWHFEISKYSSPSKIGAIIKGNTVFIRKIHAQMLTCFSKYFPLLVVSSLLPSCTVKSVISDELY